MFSSIRMPNLVTTSETPIQFNIFLKKIWYVPTVLLATGRKLEVSVT